MSQTLSVSTLLAVPLLPLAGAVLAGVFGTVFGGNWIGRRLSHTLTILGVLVAFILSALTLKSVAIDGARFNAVAITRQDNPVSTPREISSRSAKLRKREFRVLTRGGATPPVRITNWRTELVYRPSPMAIERIDWPLARRSHTSVCSSGEKRGITTS